MHWGLAAWGPAKRLLHATMQHHVDWLLLQMSAAGRPCNMLGLQLAEEADSRVQDLGLQHSVASCHVEACRACPQSELETQHAIQLA